MKFMIDKADLLSNIQYLSTVTPSKNTMPILTNYLIEAIEDNNIIKITTTDLKITVVVTFNATVMQAGKIAITARDLNEIIASLPDAPVQFTTTEEKVKIKCEKSEFELNISDYSNFPLLPDGNMDNAIDISATSFCKMINKTIVAVSKEQHQSVFTGILWELEQNKQAMVATDSKKIAHMAIESEIPNFSERKTDDGVDPTKMLKVILPTGGINFLLKIINNDSDKLKVVFSKNSVVFQYSNFKIFSHLISARFPDYNKVFPSKLPKELLIDKQQLKASIKRVSLLAPDETYKILFKISGSTLELSTSHDDKGGAKEIINDLSYNGEDITIAFNYKFLLSILDCIDTSNVKICLGEAKNPALLYNEKDDENTLLRYLIMPLRISR